MQRAIVKIPNTPRSKMPAPFGVQPNPERAQCLAACFGDYLAWLDILIFIKTGIRSQVKKTERENAELYGVFVALCVLQRQRPSCNASAQKTALALQRPSVGMKKLGKKAFEKKAAAGRRKAAKGK